MNITAICGSKNEQDIIEPFVRHTLTFCDRLILTDNSLDGSKQILEKLTGELPALSVCHLGDDKQGMNRLFKVACEDEADFVVPLCVDEFIGAGSREMFEKCLSEIPAGGVGMMPWKTYVAPAGVGCDDPLLRMAFRRKHELPQYYKVAIHRGSSANADDFVIAPGAHQALSPRGRKIPEVVLGFPLCHFPVRSYDQFAARIVVGWMALVKANPRIRGTSEAYQFRENFDVLCRDGICRENLFQYSMGYAQDPRTFTQDDVVWDDPRLVYERKYSSGRPMDAVQMIAREWERMVTK